MDKARLHGDSDSRGKFNLIIYQAMDMEIIKGTMIYNERYVLPTQGIQISN